MLDEGKKAVGGRCGPVQRRRATIPRSQNIGRGGAVHVRQPRWGGSLTLRVTQQRQIKGARIPPPGAEPPLRRSG